MTPREKPGPARRTAYARGFSAAYDAAPLNPYLTEPNRGDWAEGFGDAIAKQRAERAGRQVAA